MRYERVHARAPPIHTEENTKLIRSQNMQPIRFNPSLTVKLNANRNYEYVHDWLIFLSYLMVKYSLSFKFQSVGFGAMHMVSQFTSFYFWFHVHSGMREREREREFMKIASRHSYEEINCKKLLPYWSWCNLTYFHIHQQDYL